MEAVLPREVAQAHTKAKPEAVQAKSPTEVEKTTTSQKGVQQKLREIGEARSLLTDQHHREPSIEELAKALGVKREKLIDDLQSIREALSLQEEVPQEEFKKTPQITKPEANIEIAEKIETDTLRLFRQEIDRHPRLSSEEQDRLSKELSDQRQVMNLLKERRDCARAEGKPDPAIEAKFEEAKQEYQETRGRLVESNLALVLHIARGYQDEKIPLLDLIAEGNEALLKAADKYDYYHPKKAQFGTFAYEQIEGFLKKLVAKNSPYNYTVQSRLREIAKTRDRLAQEKGREATIEELAEALDMDPETLEVGLSRPREYVSIEEILDSEDMGSKSALERALGVDGVADEAINRAFATKLGATIRKILTPQELEVIMQRFGKELTLEETGKSLGKTKNSVAGVERKALGKLRRDPAIQKLHEAIGEGEAKKTLNLQEEIHEELISEEKQFAAELERRIGVILKPIELEVLKRRFGLGGERQDDRQIAGEVDRHHKKISDIAQRGIRKLKETPEGEEILAQLESIKAKSRKKAKPEEVQQELDKEPTEEQFAAELERRMGKILRKIELDVLKRKFGIGGEKQDDRQISENVGRSPNSVYQIVQRGVHKLKETAEGEEILAQLESIKAKSRKKTRQEEIHRELTPEEKQFAEELEKRMKTFLDPVEIEVLKRRFGLGGERQDNRQIAAAIYRRHNRVSDIAQRGIRKLRETPEGEEILAQLKALKAS